jgi:hypothetical protein
MCLDPDLDPDRAIFVIDLEGAKKETVKKKFFCLLLFEGSYIYIIFLR